MMLGVYRRQSLYICICTDCREQVRIPAGCLQEAVYVFWLERVGA